MSSWLGCYEEDRDMIESDCATCSHCADCCGQCCGEQEQN